MDFLDSLIKENFFSDRKKGERIIQTFLEEFYLNNSTDNSLSIDKLENYYTIFRASLGTIFDIGKKSSPEDLAKSLQEFQSIPEVTNIFNSFPQLQNIILDTFPSIVKTIDKKTFFDALDSLFVGNKQEILDFLLYFKKEKDLDDEEIKTKGKKLVMASNTFISSISTPDFIETSFEKVKNFNLIKSSPVLAKIFEVFNNKNLNKEAKNDLVKKILSVSNQLLEVGDGTNNSINQPLQEIINILVSNNISKDKIAEVLNFFVKQISPGTGEANINYMELGKLSWENTGLTTEIAGQWISEKTNKTVKGIKSWWNNEEETNQEADKSTLENVIKMLLEENRIQEVVDIIGGKISERVQAIANVDLEKTTREFRDTYLLKTFSQIKDVSESEKTPLQSKESDLVSSLSSKVFSSLEEKVQEKLSSPNNKTLKKEEVINVVLEEIKSFLEKSENKEKVIAYLKQTGLKIGKEDEKIIFDFITNLIGNPKLKEVIGNFLSELLKTSKKTNLSDAFAKVIGDTLKKSENTKEVVSLAMDSFDFSSKENIAHIFDLLERNGHHIANKPALIELIFIGAQNISKKDLTEIITQNIGLLKEKPDIKDLAKVAKLFFEKSNKEKLIQSLLQNDSIMLLASNKFQKLLQQKGFGDKGIELDDITQFFDAKDFVALFDRFGDKIFPLEFSQNDIIDIGLFAYSRIENKAEFLKFAKNTFIDSSSGNSGDFAKNISAEKIDIGVDLLYDLLEQAHKDKEIKQLGIELLSEYNISGIEKITDSFGRSLIDILIMSTKAIKKEDLKTFLKANINEIKILLSKQDIGEKRNIGINLGVKLMKITDMDYMQKFLSAGNESGTKAFQLKLLQEFQNIPEDKLVYLLNFGINVYENFSAGRKFESGNPNLNNIYNYAGTVFETISEIISKSGREFFNGLELASPSSSDSSKISSEQMQVIKNSFISHNKAFGFSNIFTLLSGDKKELMYRYFTNPKNKDNFQASMAEMFKK